MTADIENKALFSNTSPNPSAGFTNPTDTGTLPAHPVPSSRLPQAQPGLPGWGGCGGSPAPSPGKGRLEAPVRERAASPKASPADRKRLAESKGEVSPSAPLGRNCCPGAPECLGFSRLARTAGIWGWGWRQDLDAFSSQFRGRGETRGAGREPQGERRRLCSSSLDEH